MYLPFETFSRYWFMYLPFFSTVVPIIYKFYKWFVVLLYGHSELERIIMKNNFGFVRTIRIERSFRLSDNVMVRDGLYTLPLPKYVALSVDFKQSIIQIRGYRSLIVKADALKNLPFNTNEETHVVLLKDIWNSMIVDEPFSLKSRRWSDIGFQGSSPVTDFRGMGALGAENFRCVRFVTLVAIFTSCSCRYFVKYYNKLALSILSSSLRPQHWQLTVASSSRWNSKDTFLQLTQRDSKVGPSTSLYLFVKFNEFWNQQPRDVMQFNVYLDKFEEAIRKQMGDENSMLPLHVLKCGVTQ
ncbi:ELMO domain-containing protein [Echinococcus granulosus]|uniref:ELMO domain-containing protein n=1 Tax=Echinococcus granulosus TaxID=6210 RepID=W6UU36_ECHGR|nr:ELMO domain-containing protein [Echinococcus granulosus]EUB64823.1 ELMO domain-containing protein [Echinococcus granulosus]